MPCAPSVTPIRRCTSSPVSPWPATSASPSWTPARPEAELSHCGDPWLPEDDLARVLADESLPANVLTADDFGVSVSSAAPVRDEKGAIVAAVTVDAPTAVEGFGQPLPSEHSRDLATMLQVAAIRFSRAEVEAITDGLTGLYNHRYLHERLQEELERARRHEGTLSLLFCDCDPLQDLRRQPRPQGRGCTPSGASRGSSRPAVGGYLAARYGGEEFVRVLVDTDSAGALVVAERVRAEVEVSSARGGRALTVEHRHRHLPR